MKVPFLLLLVVVFVAECQCRRGGGSGRSRSSGSRTRSHSSSSGKGGGLFSWFGFGGSKTSSASHSQPAPSNHNPIGFEQFGQGGGRQNPIGFEQFGQGGGRQNPIGFEQFGQGGGRQKPIGFEHLGPDGNRHVYDQNNNMFASNAFQSKSQKKKDHKLKGGSIVPVPVPVPIYTGGGSSYYHGSGYRPSNTTINGTSNTRVDSLNPGFLNWDSLYFPYKPGYLLPKPGDEDRNGTLWKSRRERLLRKYENGSSFNTTTTATTLKPTSR